MIKLKELLNEVNETIKNGDVVIFKKSKGEVPKIKYNSYSKEFAADFLSHTDYYKSLKDAIEDMKNAGFVVDKYIQKESVNEAQFKDLQIGDKFLRFGENGQLWVKTSDRQAKFVKNVGKKTAKYNKSSGSLEVFPPTMDITLLNESNTTYFRTAAMAADFARKQAEKRGYEVDDRDWAREIGFGGKYSRLRPSVGKTHSFSIGLTKDGKPQRKALHISLYGLDGGNFELTTYIN